MSFLKKLFGGGMSSGGDKEAPSEIYEGYTITPNPMKADGGFRLAAKITLDVEGEMKEHQLIRADVITDYQECVTSSLNKAKQVIKEQGMNIFR